MTVSLRPVVDDDLETLFAFQADPVAAQLGALKVRSREAFFAHWRQTVLPNADSVVRVIEVAGAVAGSVVSFRLEASEPLSVGYLLGQAFWGRGVATEALRLFLLQHERRRPLVASVAVGNPASGRVLEKCGFVAEGLPKAAEDGVVERHFRLER